MADNRGLTGRGKAWEMLNSWWILLSFFCVELDWLFLHWDKGKAEEMVFGGCRIFPSAVCPCAGGAKCKKHCLRCCNDYFLFRVYCGNYFVVPCQKGISDLPGYHIERKI